MGSIASAVGGVLGSVGGMISGDAAAGAANEQADYLRNLSAEQQKMIIDLVKQIDNVISKMDYTYSR